MGTNRRYSLLNFWLVWGEVCFEEKVIIDQRSENLGGNQKRPKRFLVMFLRPSDQFVRIWLPLYYRLTFRLLLLLQFY